jgi:hypothetical protein
MLNIFQLISRELCAEVKKSPNIRSQNIQEYILDKEFNYSQYVVYHNLTKKHAIFVIRGTANTSELINAIYIIMDVFRESDRFQETTLMFLRFHKKYKKHARISVTGHSLGGFETILLGEKYNKKIHSGVAFNAAYVPSSEYKISSNIQHIRSLHDTFSLGWRGDPQTIEIDRPVPFYMNLPGLNTLAHHKIDFFK